jgi:hypothetical protein
MSGLGQKRTSASRSGMSALALKADLLGVEMNVCFVPLADVALAVDHRRKKQGNPKLSRVRNLPNAAPLFLAAIHANGAPTHGPSGHAGDADRR